MFAVILSVMLIGSFLLLGTIIYKRFERIQFESKSVEVDKSAFNGLVTVPLIMIMIINNYLCV